jgi:hypothetical protein
MSDLTERLLDIWQNTEDDECADTVHEAIEHIAELEAALREARGLVDELDPRSFLPDEWDVLMSEYPRLRELWAPAR